MLSPVSPEMGDSFILAFKLAFHHNWCSSHFAWGIAPRPNVYRSQPSLCVCLSLAAIPHYCRHPEVILGNGRGCPLVVHYWADLQSVAWFCCYGNIHIHIQYRYYRLGHNANVCRSTSMLFGQLCQVYRNLFSQLPVKFNKALCLAIWTAPSQVFPNPNPILKTASQVKKTRTKSDMLESACIHSINW